MSRANWELILEAARELTTRGMREFTRASLLDEVRRLDPHRRPESLAPAIQGMTVNATGGRPSPCGTPLKRIGYGVYQLVESAGRPAATMVPSPTGPPSPPSNGEDLIDVVLVGCAKSKVNHASPARLLYRSPLFDKRRSYAEAHARAWYVLSAEHGLVHPETLLEPYDVALADQPEDYRQAWAQWVVAKLRQTEGGLRGLHVEIHAGQAYTAPLLPLLRAAGAHVVHPLSGLGLGEQLSWYDSPSSTVELPPQANDTDPALAEEDGPEPADSWLSNVTLIDGPNPAPPFTYSWPEGNETFQSAADVILAVDGRRHELRVAVCDRQAYGQQRRRIVVFAGSQPLAEGVGVDDYPRSRSLAGLLKDADGRMIRPGGPVPEVYGGFPIVNFSSEVTGPYTRAGLAVLLREDDYVSWSVFALARRSLRAGVPPPTPSSTAPATAAPPPPVPTQRAGDTQPAGDTQRAVVAALLRFGREHQQQRLGRDPQFTPHPQANRLILDDPYAFLLGVIFDHGILAERAWRAPYELRLRLGHLDPVRMSNEPQAVRAAVARRPTLHRFVERMPRWLVQAAQRVVDEYGGDAATIWSDNPRAADLTARLRRFHGISQKKSAMAVEMLARDLRVPVRDLTGSDIAYDVHVRRVFLRTRLATHDDQDHMVEVARRLHPERPGELDYPAWLIGRQWCGAGIPDCGECPLSPICPKDILRAAGVTGG